MNGLTLASSGVIATVGNPGWTIRGVGDLDGNGTADLVWRNTTTGAVAGWLMHGLTKAADGIPGSAPTTWNIAGIGDVDGDGQADLVWRDTSTGDVRVWLMNGVSAPTTGLLASGEPLDWHIAGVGDLAGNGTADVVWRRAN